MMYRCSTCNSAFEIKLKAGEELTPCGWCNGKLARAEMIRTMDGVARGTFRSTDPGSTTASYYRLNKKKTKFFLIKNQD